MRKHALTALPLNPEARSHLQAVKPLIMDQVDAGQYVAYLVGQKITRPDEQTLRSIYEQRKERFTSRPQYQFDAIVLPLSPAQYRDQYQAAVAILHQIQTGQLSFTDGARHHSQHPSKDQGGRLGWINEGSLTRMGINLVRAARAMSKGQVSDLIEEGSQLWILRLNDRKEPVRYPFEKVRNRIENFVGQQQAQALERALIQSFSEELQLQFPESVRK